MQRFFLWQLLASNALNLERNCFRAIYIVLVQNKSASYSDCFHHEIVSHRRIPKQNNQIVPCEIPELFLKRGGGGGGGIVGIMRYAKSIRSQLQNALKYCNSMLHEFYLSFLFTLDVLMWNICASLLLNFSHFNITISN